MINTFNFMKYKTKRLNIREITPKDIAPLLRIYQKGENMRYVSDGKFDWTALELMSKYKKTNKDYDKGIGIFAIELIENNEIIGEIGLFDSFHDFSKLEIGYIIDCEFQSKGFGKEACMGLLKYAKEKLNAQSIIARMYSKNLSSVKLSESCGMVKLSKKFTDNNELYYTFEKQL